MSGSGTISRRLFAGGALVLGLAAKAFAQGFAGLGETTNGFAPVVPGKTFAFPADHGPHPDFRIEWWYVTANLVDANGVAYGVQWTLFRQAIAAGAELEGWANQQIWMGHAAVTSAQLHRTSETFARGGVGQAGVEASTVSRLDRFLGNARAACAERCTNIAPLALNASGADFSYALRLDADRPLVLQGDGGYSRKSERERASSLLQPAFFHRDRQHHHRRQADRGYGPGMAGPRVEQPAAGAGSESGWDWLSLHLSIPARS